MKDFNDCLKAGIEIRELPSLPIDIFALRQTLNKCENKDAEWNAAEGFIKTVSNQMIKIEISRFLSERWEEKIDDIRDWMKVSSKESTVEIIKEFKTIDDCLNLGIERLKSPTYGLGWASIDKAFGGGTRQNDVVLYGAYSKVGKTSTMAEVVLHSVVREKMNVVVFSMEMDAGAFTNMMLCKFFGCNLRSLKEMLLSAEQFEAMEKVKNYFAKHLYIVDTNGLNMKMIDERVKIANTSIFDTPVRRVFVDYFQYMAGVEDYNIFAAEAQSMKPFCKSNNCELHMLSQFSRTGFQWIEPTIRDFKGGNNMESSFDKAMLLWRPGLDPKLSPLDRDAQRYVSMYKLESREGIIGKNIFEMEYDPQTTRINEKILNT